jgi:hypothetical protein
MSETHDQPQGPTDPQGPGGADAPPPPGGPQRTDSPGPTLDPDELEPDEAPDEEEYVGEDPGALSPETGTVYDEHGEPEMTPHDLEVTSEDEE